MPVVELDGPRRERGVDAELVSPAPRGGIRRGLPPALPAPAIVGRQLAQMYAASLLGLLWSYIQPATALHGVLLRLRCRAQAHRAYPNFALHLFTGMVFVHYFTETWSGGTRSIWATGPSC